MSCLRHFDILTDNGPWTTFLRCIAKFKFDILESVGSHASRSISERLCLPLMSGLMRGLRSDVQRRAHGYDYLSRWRDPLRADVLHELRGRCAKSTQCFSDAANRVFLHILPCQDLIRSRTLHYSRKRISGFWYRRTIFVKVRWQWSSWLILIPVNFLYRSMKGKCKSILIRCVEGGI